MGLIPGLGRSPGDGNSNPLQYLCLENLMDRGAWWAAVHGVANSRARLSRTNTMALLYIYMYVCAYCIYVLYIYIQFSNYNRRKNLPPPSPLWAVICFPVIYTHWSWSSLLECYKRSVCMCAKLFQSYPTLCNPMDCSPQGFSVHMIS